MNVIQQRGHILYTHTSRFCLFNSITSIQYYQFNNNNNKQINRFYNSNSNIKVKRDKESIKMNESDKKELIENYTDIKTKVDSAAKKSGAKDVTLVAVSKTKPAEMIQVLYNEVGHKHFGENYIQELIGKSDELATLTPEIKWHFIGSIQSNKVKMLAAVKNLYVVETIERKEIVDKLAKAWTGDYRLNVMVQVNTSNQESKSGCEPDQVVEIVQHIIQDPQCSSKINFLGLMTIGDPDATPDQPDFKCLSQCKQNVSEKLNIPLDSIQLSMGMSHDFEPAIEFGSTSVRVGSAIFGQRDYSKK